MIKRQVTRAAIYGRYSSNLQSPHSTEDQFSIGRDYAARAGFEVVGFYGDDAKTGRFKKKRNGFLDLERDTKNGKFDVIVIEDVDRVARNGAHALAFHALLEMYQVEVHGVAGPTDRFVFHI